MPVTANARPADAVARGAAARIRFAASEDWLTPSQGAEKPGSESSAASKVAVSVQPAPNPVSWSR